MNERQARAHAPGLAKRVAIEVEGIMADEWFSTLRVGKGVADASFA
ncbi:MAG: hypothetical protein V3R16_10450 [Nitrospirales bacterium]